MDMFDLTSFKERLSERAQKVIKYSIEDAQRRNHYYLGVEHIFHSLSVVEMKLFNLVFESAGVDPGLVRKVINNYLDTPKQYLGVGVKITPEVKLLFQHAFENSRNAGRYLITSVDLFIAVFQNSKWIPARIVREFGLTPQEVINGIVFHAKKREILEKELKKKFELPPFLKQFGVNLNELAYLDRIPPLIGREKEIEEVVTILCQKERCNSVMLVGEAGVGKTAIAEGLARKIEFEPETLPPQIRNKQIINIQMNSVVAGTVFRGMFEERMEKIIKELKESKNYIMFIDEAHTIIGTGSAMGVPADAANILKSALSKGEIQIIGATTFEEYRMYIQEDSALSRRFQVVYVEEPSLEDTRKILKELKGRFENTYNIKISDEAIDTIIELSKRYSRHLRLPDKAIRWLTNACVKTQLTHPYEPLSPEDIYQVVSKDARIPLVMVKRDVLESFRDFEIAMSKRIVGQRHVIEGVGKKLRMNKGPLKENFKRPDGVFLFLGPTGVGKTETAKALAEFLYGDEERIIRIDMSEFTDGAVSVDKLIGMPRGIVGSEMGGVLTNKIRENPSSVVLLDEIEKAHPLVFNLFLQVFDEGFLTDGRGKRVYFSDAIIIMTSNVGSSEIEKMLHPPGFISDEGNVRKNLCDVIKKAAENYFSPEFFNRIDEVFVFYPLTKEEVEEITRRYLNSINQQLLTFGKSLLVSEDAIKLLAKLGYSMKYGARYLKRTVDEKVKVPVALLWNDGSTFIVEAEGEDISVKVSKVKN